MSEQEVTPQAPPTKSFESFREALESVVGKVVTVVNPESYEASPMGARLTTGFYRAKVQSVGKDVMTCISEMKGRSKDAKTQQVKQFMAIDHIKRISLTREGLMIHL